MSLTKSQENYINDLAKTHGDDYKTVFIASMSCLICMSQMPEDNPTKKYLRKVTFILADFASRQVDTDIETLIEKIQEFKRLENLS